ncbi:hypothetical protein AVEN_64185-1 [Araneus ventricosus]|uniref:Uncharacterized protein n=1 Tax=Araneus ventricosus TaxID=182803 RepID=A0A4Y2SLD1_ARAVE|nr:hypothetical protein AVEN_64185-1 [Araneus ventricosus]
MDFVICYREHIDVSRTTRDPAYPLVQTSTPHQQENCRPSTSDLMLTRPNYLVVLRWNRICNLESTDFKADTLPPGNHGPSDVTP